MLELIGVDGLTQWDVGRQIKVDKDIDMVHFSNRPYGYSKNVKVTDGVADVPDMFLTSCAPLRIWAYVGDFEKGYTKIEKIYEVKPKNRPEDYIYTPEDLKTWEKLQSEIGNLSDLATEAKENLVAAINEVAADMSEGIALDTTLSEAGKAADAKAVGDALAEKQPKGDYLTQDNLQSATDAVLEQAKSSGEFDGVDGKDGADGKSAYQYAQDGGYTGTEAEFTEKLAKEIPEALPNPNALTFTGAVNATYDGSTAVSVEIPSGGSGGTDISLGLTSAAVGQTIKVKAIDESGKPTAWDAADMPSGGGETWEKISDVSLTQDVSSYILASFGTYRKIKIMMERDTYVSGLSKNVWVRISSPNKNDFYTVGYLNIEYGYIKWEANVEVNNEFISGHIICSNNPNASANLSWKVSKELGDTAVSDLSLRLDFNDVSVIQEGDSVSVWGVRW